MAIIRKESKYNVVDIARIRIKNVFSNGLPVYMTFSGGKDSLCIAHLVYSLIQEGEIDPKQLTVNFIDEEAILPCQVEVLKDWRRKFMLVGSTFNWFCLEIRHFNALNKLGKDESFITWDRYKADKWVRQKPKYAITYHPLNNPRKETYQTFLDRLQADGITITGIRVSESVQRLRNFAVSEIKNRLHPIYDWKDSDVWKYLLDNDVEIPKAYLYLWQTGVSKRNLRLSHSFSSDTVVNLVNLNQYYPDLMKKIIEREPNAYLVSLYWDSEMFKKNTKNRKQLEKDKDTKDYKKEVTKMLNNINKYFNTLQERELAREYKKLILRFSLYLENKHWKKIYESLIVGDPHKRTYRGILTNIVNDFKKDYERGKTK